MMRVLHFYKTAYPDSVGGVEQVIDQIATGCAQRGIATDVLTLAGRGCAPLAEVHGYRLHRVPSDFELASTGVAWRAFARFAALARQADVVHYHFPWPWMDVVHFATHARVRKPTVVTYHSDIVRQQALLRLYQPLQNRFLRSVDAIVATSPNYLHTSPVLARVADKVQVIPIGLDKDAYPTPAPERLQAWRQRLGERFFLFVGVLRYYKGLHILLQAAQGQGWPIVIAGAGPIEAELKAQAAALGLRQVHFLGFVPEDDKAALLQLCHAVVFPSHLRSEAFGVSLLEGAMFGKPLISSEIGTGTSYINIAGETGLVVPPNDASALRAAMQHLWEHPAQAAAMGQRAALRFEKHFTATRMIHAYEELYAALMRWS